MPAPATGRVSSQCKNKYRHGDCAMKGCVCECHRGGLPKVERARVKASPAEFNVVNHVPHWGGR